MKYEVPRCNWNIYARSLARSILTLTDVKEWEDGKFSDDDLDKVITALEITYDDVKRMMNIRQG